MQQAEDRVHRMGQVSNGVNIYYIMSEETLDEYILEHLQKVSNLTTQISNGQKEGLHFKEDCVIKDV